MRIAAALFALFPQICAADVSFARYVEPTDAYGHGALAGGEYAALEVGLTDGRSLRLSYLQAVFEDTEPRLADLDADGDMEIITVVSTFDQGARIQVFDVAEDGILPIASTAPIGTRHRWLSIAGIADFDDNGLVEVAFVDRPHLAKVLRFVEFDLQDETFTVTPKAALEGHTNHRIGESAISGGLRSCDGTPEVITASANWSRVLVTRGYETRDIGPYDGPQSLVSAVACEV